MAFYSKNFKMLSNCKVSMKYHFMLHRSKKTEISYSSLRYFHYGLREKLLPIWNVAGTFSKMSISSSIHFGSKKNDRSKSSNGSSFSDGTGRTQCVCGGTLAPVRPTDPNSFVYCKKCQAVYNIFERSSSRENSEKSTRLPPPKPKMICEYLDKYVIGQEPAKKTLAVQVYAHYNRIFHNAQISTTEPDEEILDGPQVYSKESITPIEFTETKPQTSKQTKSKKHGITLSKSNVIMLGQTGSGKTYLAEVLAACIDVPFAICDCTTMTQAGYVGSDVDSCLVRMFDKANKDIKKTEQGIIFLDEVDKIAAMSTQGCRDVGGTGVQQALLKMLEGTVVDVRVTINMMPQTIQIDTSNILFIASGAFTGLEKIVKKRKHQKTVGFAERTLINKRATDCDDKQDLFEFNADEDPQLENDERDMLLGDVETNDVIEYGLIPEFVGRFPVITALHSLNEDMLMRILVEPEDSLISQYKVQLSLDQCHLVVTDEALRAIAKLAIAKRTGARGLRSILERVLVDVRYEVPGSDICAVTITKEVIESGCEPILSYRSTGVATTGNAKRILGPHSKSRG